MGKKNKDFPEINYSFMGKSTYKHEKKSNVIKIILSLIILAFTLYTIFFLFAKNDNEFLNNVIEKLNTIGDKKTTTTPEENENVETIEPAQPVIEGAPQKQEEKVEEKPVEEAKPKIDLKEYIILQTSVYGLTKEEEIEKAKSAFKEKTGENFEDAILFKSDTELIPAEIISSLTQSQASIMRNEIYARHGYPFQQGRLLNYFYQKSWYTRKTVNVQLNEIEKENVNAIYSYERSKGWKK